MHLKLKCIKRISHQAYFENGGTHFYSSLKTIKSIMFGIVNNKRHSILKYRNAVTL